MGCDIHGVWQAWDGQSWADVESEYQQDRHYLLFAALAGVRDGYDMKPIAPPRGWPDDFQRSHSDEHGRFWMGDHSHSWLDADEMLAWAHPPVLRSGVIPREAFCAWDGVSSPDSYVGGIWGPGVIAIDADEASTSDAPWTHVRVRWMADVMDELDYFFAEVRRLRDLHGRVRFVFGFDS
jgi:hypothetical protein